MTGAEGPLFRKDCYLCEINPKHIGLIGPICPIIKDHARNFPKTKR